MTTGRVLFCKLALYVYNTTPRSVRMMIYHASLGLLWLLYLSYISHQSIMFIQLYVRSDWHHSCIKHSYQNVFVYTRANDNTHIVDKCIFCLICV